MHTSPFLSPFVYTFGCHISESKTILGGRRGYSYSVSIECQNLDIIQLTSGKINRAFKMAPSYNVSAGLWFAKAESDN